MVCLLSIPLQFISLLSGSWYVCVCVCVQVTDDVKQNRESSPPVKRSRGRRVTFNPNVQERALLPAKEPLKPVALKEAADIVVHYLDPFYTQGKFATKVREADIWTCPVRTRQSV